jgi:LGFP repeat
MDIDRFFPAISARFRGTHDFARRHGFAGGFPNFHRADSPRGTVFGNLLLKDSVAEFRDVSATDLGSPAPEDLGARFRAAHAFARRSGFIGALPNFFQAGEGPGLVYGTMLLRENVAEFRDVLADELGNPDPNDIAGRFRATHDFARRNGFMAGFPNFFEADTPRGRVYGTLLIKEQDVVFQDLTSHDLFPQVFGAIGDRWLTDGGITSALGAPATGELGFDEGGKVQFFLGGAIYWWPDTGAMVLPSNRVSLRFTGLNCFGITDLPGDDEPYVLFGVTTPQASTAPRTRIFEGVKAGTHIAESMDLYRGPPVGVGLSVVLMEHNIGDPERYRSVVERVVEEARPRISAALTMIPVVGPVLGVAAEITMTALKGDITDALSRLVGLEDDQLGSQNVALSPKRLIELAARSPLREEHGVPFRLQSQLFTGQGSTYKVAFDVSPG